MSRGGDLLRLQEIDSRRAQEGARLRDIEARISTDPELEHARREARRRRRDKQAADAALATAESEAEVLARRARELDRHLYDGSVRNPQELLGMQHDLDAVRERTVAHDELLLERMQDAETAAVALRDANAGVVEREQERADQAGDLLAQAAAMRAAVEDRERERAEIVAALPAADLALFERLSRRLQPAVVRINGDSCGGCRMPFSSAEVRRIRIADSPVQCGECDRLVVP